MSEYECVVVPEMEWNLRRQQRQAEAAEQVVQGSEEKHKGMGNHHHQQHYNIDNNINSRSSSHVRPLFQQNPHPIMSNNTIEELTWENGQLSMCGHRDTTKPVWPGSNDTLESIVHQASHNKTNPIYVIDGHHLSKMGDEKNKHFISSSSSSGQKITVETSGADQTESILMMKKRPRSESEQCGTNNTNLFSNSSSYSKGDHYHQAGIDPSFCGSASATFCKDEGTMMTWPSFDSSRNLKSKKTFHPAEDSSASLGISANQDEDGKTKTDQTGRSHSSRRSSRVAANHNQSERKRRDRINQKMRALQRLVPNAYKTDKASMLDEVIEYLKQLQAQVETMMSMRNINVPHFTMMPLAGIAQAQQQQQQQLQLSLFSRMVGLGMGMGMVNANSVARAAAAQPPPPLMHSVIPPQFAMQSPPNPPPAVVPVAHPTVPEKTGTRSNVPSLPILDPFMSAFLAQNMNIDLYNRMAAAVYRQQQMGNPSTTHQLGREE